ncbi:lactadherin-like [Clavelina lepadiformis]|uniref:EGF-like repeat and discoidin I-like domain-containing protein 3 n=1 Tax=Clavelina lepadiformis TaxID=159417 RepID=A0ABP0GSN3_CLALP
MMKQSLLLIFVFLIGHGNGQDKQLCFPIRTSENDSRSAVFVNPSGWQGEPGFPGPPGQCDCESDMAQMKVEMKKMNDTVVRLMNLVEIFNQTLHPPPDPCRSSPCEQGRICKSEGVRYTCECLDGFGGNGCTLYYANTCNTPVGMESRKVENEDITASSQREEYLAQDARLNNRRGKFSMYGYWIPETIRAGEWIQVDLIIPTRVVAVVTQGGHHDGWVTTYKISYGYLTNRLQYIRGNDNRVLVFQGNRDRKSWARNNFPEPVQARYFRLVIRTWHQASGLRLEYITC